MYRYNSILQYRFHSTTHLHNTPHHSTQIFTTFHVSTSLEKYVEAVCMQMENKWICWQLIIFTKCRIRYLFSVINIEGQISCHINLVDFFLRSHKLLFKKNDNEIYREELPMWDLDISGFRWISKNVLLSWEFMVCESSFRALFWFIHNTHGHLHNFINIHTHNSCNAGNIIEKLVLTCI